MVENQPQPIVDGLARAVRELRRGRGWTRRELGQRTGISERYLADIETGRGNPSLLRLAALAEAFDLRIDSLVARASRPAPGAARTKVALLGLRGAGKSTVGARLAERIRAPFCELDDRVEKRAGLTLNELFQLHGERYYRRLEVEALRDLLGEPGAMVIATGGGLVTVEETFALLRRHAFTVWLRARPEDHWMRVVAQGDTRPMADDELAFQNLCSILAEREVLYGRADKMVDTSDRDPDTIADELALQFSFLAPGGITAS